MTTSYVGFDRRTPRPYSPSTAANSLLSTRTGERKRDGGDEEWRESKKDTETEEKGEGREKGSVRSRENARTIKGVTTIDLGVDKTPTRPCSPRARANARPWAPPCAHTPQHKKGRGKREGENEE